jgi:hypothetical protein
MNGKLKFCVVGVICCAGLSAMGQERPVLMLPHPPTFSHPPLPGRHPIQPQPEPPGLGPIPIPFPPLPIFPEQPLNDTFANRAVIYSSWPSATNWISGSLSNATSEAGEPFIDGVSSGQTVWGTWTAPSNGIVTLSINADTFSPLLTVYAGSAPISYPPTLGVFPGSAITESVFTNLSLIASNNYLACYEHSECGCHWRERNQITFHVAGGQAYQICVDSAIITDASWIQQLQTWGQYNYYTWAVEQTTNIPVGGDVQLGLQFTPAPKNDDFVNRIKLSGSRVVTNASNVGATKQSGEPDHLGNPGGSSVWYSWTAPASGRVTLSTNEVPSYAPPSSSGGYGVGTIYWQIIPGPPTCGNLIDQNPPPVFYPLFAAYTGTAVASLTSANYLPAALAAFPNMVEFDAVKGQTYQIAFDGNLGTTGDIPFYLELTPPASNDSFAKRIPLHGIYVVATGYNAGATHQTGEPVFGSSSGKTVWWSWTAPASGTVSIDLSGSDYVFPVAVFAGATLGKLQMVSENSGGVSFEAIAGQIYQIAVSDFGGLTGVIDLKLEAPIVELPLLRVTKNSFNSAQLFYAASAGQVILLQRSKDGTNWQNLQESTASSNTIQFSVRPSPAGNGPYYRAIVVDLLPGNHR